MTPIVSGKGLCKQVWPRSKIWSQSVCVQRGDEVEADECAGDGHSCYLLVMSDTCQSNHVELCVALVVM